MSRRLYLFVPSLLQTGFKISEISADISAIFRVSVNTDTIYPLDNRPTEISKFFGNYRRYFADISVFYRFFAIYRNCSWSRHCS